jgi:hypothetical protein
MRVLCVGIGVSMFGSLLLACETPRGEPITIRTSAPPALVAYREDASNQWRRLDATSATSFALEASGPFHVIIACDDRGGSQRHVNIVELARTPEDGSFDHPCGGARTLAVTAKLTQMSTVFLGEAKTTRPPGNPFQLRVAPSTYDLVALQGNFRDGYGEIAIRHAVKVDANLDLGVLDPTEGAQPTIATEFTAENALPDELLSTSVTLVSGNTVAILPVWSSTARLVPEALLAPGGHQTVMLSALGTQPDGNPPHQMRRVSRMWRPGLATAVRLPPLMGPATLVNDGPRLIATWSSLPSYDRLEVEREKIEGEIERGIVVHQSLVLSRAFVEQVGITSATLDPSDVPGFLPDWTISAETTVTRLLNVVRGDATDFEQTAIGDSAIFTIGS